MIANDVVRDLKRSGGTCRIFKLDFHKALIQSRGITFMK